MNIIKPPKLNPGDAVGIVASSLPVLPSHQEKFEKGKKMLYDLGFKIKEGETIGKSKWWMAGTPREVAEDINAMFADKEVKAIIAHTGGYSALTVLEYLDYGLIKKTPKPYVGLSDVTNFHIAFFTKCNLVGFHMDDVTFGLSAWEGKSMDLFLKFLTQDKAPGIIKPFTDWEQWKKGKASGCLIGGNLHLLCSLIGTPYFPPLEVFNGAIFFWEEVGEPLNNIARFLTQLKYLGVFDRIAGMLIGKITYIKPMREKEIVEPSVKEMVLDILKDYNFPVMANMDFGHFTLNIPMPIGIKVEFNTSKQELNFIESSVI